MARLPYRVLNPISYYGERAERGAVVLLEPTDAENIGASYVEAIDAPAPAAAPVEEKVDVQQVEPTAPEPQQEEAVAEQNA